MGPVESTRKKSTGCGFDPHSRKWNIYLHIYFHFFALVSKQSVALRSATQHAMPPELGRKWATECLNTRLPLPTLLCAGYSVKLIDWLTDVWFIIHGKHLGLKLEKLIMIVLYLFCLTISGRQMPISKRGAEFQESRNDILYYFQYSSTKRRLIFSF